MATTDFLVAERPLSSASVIVEPPDDQTSAGLTLSWNDLGYSIKDKPILSDLYGSVEPGQVLAVMGPSGAGKSTFLDVIAGRKGNAGVLHGQVLLNGTERPMKKYSSYVTQDDSLIGCFTVRETIRYAVEMGQPTTSKKVRDEKVHELLTQFGLMKCADSPVGDLIISGISGGEKRRLSIAVQLVKEPKIIFLDEPTTGLDSAASFRVMESIRDMARRRNCTVVCSIHQPSPSTYALFDQVLFLARGNTVYYGPNKGPEAAYFKTVGLEIPVHSNIPDVVLDNINVDFLGDESLANSHIDHLSKAWSNSNGRVESISAFESSLKLMNKAGDGQGMIVGGGDYIHSFGKQIEILTRRNLHNALKNILLFWARIGLYASMSVLMGTTWLRMPTNQNTVQDRFSAIFFAIAFLAFMSVAGIPAILEERAVFYRERMNRTYSVGAYVIANTLVSLPFIFIIAVSFATPAYWMMGLNAGASNFFIFITYLWLALYVAESFVVLISAMFPIFVAALTLVSFFNGLEMVTQGFFVRRDNIPAFWKYVFHYWNYQKWSWEALIANEFVGLTFQCDPKPSGNGCFCSIPSSLGPDACTFSGEDVIANYGYTDYSYWKSTVCLLALIVFYRLAFYVTLRVKKPKV